jgi:glyoxylase-like metal-dependent hydrolase (beta-lactamase superfamily II)
MTQLFTALQRASVAGALAFGLSGGALSQTPYPAAVQKHLDAATVNAAGDKDIIDYIRRNSCFEVEDLTWRTWARSMDSHRVPLTQVFDNLWFLGTKYTSMYFLKTADGGVMLIDALNNTADANNYIIPALQQLNLPLRGIYISHGHGDHDGGVNRLREVYG